MRSTNTERSENMSPIARDTIGNARGKARKGMTMRTTLAVLAAVSLFGTTACAGSLNLPGPPVDGIEQAKKDAEAKKAKDAEEAAAKQQAAATEAQAQQSGIVEGGPSVVPASMRLQYMTTTDITVLYKGLHFTPLNTETSEITIPANSRAVSEGVAIPLSQLPRTYADNQMLPAADLNGAKITILKMTMRTDALVLTILGDKFPEGVDWRAEGTLLLKSPDAMYDPCQEGPGVDCSGRNLFGRDWTNKVLNGMIIRNANATNLNAPGASLVNADFSGAQLFRGNFLGANVTGAKFRGIKGQNLMMNSDKTASKNVITQAGNTDFTGAYLYRCELDHTNMPNSTWDKADAQNCTFDGANMTGFRAQGAWLHRIKASNVNLSGMIAPNARMSQGTFAKANFTNGVATGALMDRIEAKDADFTNFVLTGKGCTMAQSYLDGATMVRMSAALCSFPRASMKNVDATSLNAPGSDFTYTDVKGSNFEGANLMGANFFNSDTKGARFTKAQIGGLVCPNGDIVGKTAYGRYGNQVVTNCSWDDNNYSISGKRVFKSQSVPVKYRFLDVR